MKIIYKNYQKKTAPLNDINEILFATDNDFIPKLSQKKKITEISDKFKNYAVVVIAYVDNIPAGLVAFYSNASPKLSYLSVICVKKEYRKYGIGKNLELRCIEICKENNSSGIELNMRKSNLALLNSRLKIGYTIMREYQDNLSSEIIVDLILNLK